MNAIWNEDNHTRLLLKEHELINYTDFKMKMPKNMKNTFQKILQTWELSGYLEIAVHMASTFQNWNIHKDTEKILSTPNAGGSSVISEAVSFELLNRLFGAELLATEMEIVYNFDNTKKTDILCEIEGISIAISVTRAMKYNEFTIEMAIRLLEKKLSCVLGSNLAVSDKYAWFKQLLYIWVQEPEIAKILRETYEDYIKPEYKANTIVLIVLADQCWFLF